MATIFVAAQALGDAVGLGFAIPSDALKSLGDVDEKKWATLHGAAKASFNNNKNQKEQVVRGEFYQFIKELFLGDANTGKREASLPRNADGHPLTHYFNNGLYRVASKDGKLLHFVAKRHLKELERKGFLVDWSRVDTVSPVPNGGNDPKSCCTVL
mmetsp:Transcript_34037/g.47407  ORF Transcript_34037/g.47407 Transcript_34037/m.47407 type:complete len:156 (+) Transcript_34037:1584-2051(+)